MSSLKIKLRKKRRGTKRKYSKRKYSKRKYSKRKYSKRKYSKRKQKGGSNPHLRTNKEISERRKRLIAKRSPVVGAKPATYSSSRSPRPLFPSSGPLFPSSGPLFPADHGVDPAKEARPPDAREPDSEKTAHAAQQPHPDGGTDLGVLDLTNEQGVLDMAGPADATAAAAASDGILDLTDPPPGTSVQTSGAAAPAAPLFWTDSEDFKREFREVNRRDGTQLWPNVTEEQLVADDQPGSIMETKWGEICMVIEAPWIEKEGENRGEKVVEVRFPEGTPTFYKWEALKPVGVAGSSVARPPNWFLWRPQLARTFRGRPVNKKQQEYELEKEIMRKMKESVDLVQMRLVNTGKMNLEEWKPYLNDEKTNTRIKQAVKAVFNTQEIANMFKVWAIPSRKQKEIIKKLIGEGEAANGGEGWERWRGEIKERRKQDGSLSKVHPPSQGGQEVLYWLP